MHPHSPVSRPHGSVCVRGAASLPQPLSPSHCGQLRPPWLKHLPQWPQFHLSGRGQGKGSCVSYSLVSGAFFLRSRSRRLSSGLFRCMTFCLRDILDERIFRFGSDTGRLHLVMKTQYIIMGNILHEHHRKFTSRWILGQRHLDFITKALCNAEWWWSYSWKSFNIERC